MVIAPLVQKAEGHKLITEVTPAIDKAGIQGWNSRIVMAALNLRRINLAEAGAADKLAHLREKLRLRATSCRLAAVN